VEPVDLGALIRQSLETLRTSGKSLGHEFRAHIAEEPLTVTGDPVRLEQVFWNLMDNALKYSPPNTAVTVTVEREGDCGVIRIQDRGLGIAPEMLPVIFDLFPQIDSSLARSQGGLGLGLALVQSLVEQHGGKVSASSEGLGQGSEFVVRLPLGGSGSPLRSEPRPSGATQRPQRVLVVEDKIDARESLRAVLELAGHQVRCAEDGFRAIDVAVAWVPDAALVDVGLPGIDGYEVARRLRASAMGATVRLVAVTGYGPPDDRRRAMESGFDAHLVKPVTAEDLDRVLNARVPRSSGRGTKEPT
jgi:CheY-like chemotaxis protein